MAVLPPIEYLLIFFAILLFSLSVHEAAHAWTADRLGDPTARLLGRITLNPMAHIDWIGTVLFPLMAIMSGLPLLGWAKPVPVNFHQLRAPRRDFAIIAAAGPASNLVLAVIGALLVSVVDPDGLGGSLVGAVLRQAVSLNVLLAVFNMVPVPPLDGGNVLSGLLPESLARVVDLMRPWGFLLLYALLLTGALSTYVFPIARAITDRLLPVF
jgi:Zn-dependent protease